MKLFNQSLIILLFFYITFISALQLSGQTIYDEKRVVFSTDQRISLNAILRDASYSRFTPSNIDIDSTDIIIQKNFPLTYNEKKVNSFENYFRQYYGLVINGRKLIFLNGYCFKPEGFLENKSGFKGGGNCFFIMLVDITNKKIDSLYFNAPK